ncbi:DNA translocase FtsK [Pseudomonas savastanoi]|uniref:DNA translocase FtsK n=1 Tax=Pseudomonas savastanoi TaxID=29438 RepID=UPI00177FA056|nr:DNA translocase FtsK [Pseudomonas savastanoi]QOI04585.1 hypothetical protein D5S10_12300 [Pseudomonas savastanoi]
MSNDKMREEFEAWALARFINSATMKPLQRSADEPDGYHYPVLNTAWDAWKASREAQEKSEASPEVQAMLSQFEADEADEIRRAEAYVRATGRASISALQRNFKMGYGSACRLMEKLVTHKVVSPIDAEGRRTVLPEQVKP